MSKAGYAPRWMRLEWAVAIIVMALAAFAARPGNAGPKNDVTGTVSKNEPPTKEDGTPGHPFADASQCPSSADVIIWPKGHSMPSIPPGISVCFVGKQSFSDHGPSVRVRQR